MISLFKIYTLVLIFHSVLSLSFRKEASVVDRNVAAAAYGDCDPSTIPVMDNFDLKKFSGKWFELAKTVTGYIDTVDGVWLIEGTNASHTFLFSGRDNNQHCIRPIKGKVTAAPEPPGLLNLHYKTYSTHVEETVRVLFTDYSTIAVIYTCMHHIHTDKEVCHSAGLYGAIWTRSPHVTEDIFEVAASYLEKACIDKSSLVIRNIKGPCKVDQWDPRLDDFPAPDYCYQPMNLGSCPSSLQRYYYDANEKICKRFIYSGCGGNNNNFMSLSECQIKCAIGSNKDPVCMSVAKCALHCSPCCTEDNNGCVHCDCEHVVEDNFLNCVSSPSQCPDECDVENLFQGCHVCRCGDVIKLDDELGICNEVKLEGNCNDSIERYYFDAVNEECLQFTFSGCGGNSNNFLSLQECMEKCLRIDPTRIFHGAGNFLPDSSTLHTSRLLLIVVLLFVFCLINNTLQR